MGAIIKQAFIKQHKDVVQFIQSTHNEYCSLKEGHRWDTSFTDPAVNGVYWKHLLVLCVSKGDLYCVRGPAADRACRYAPWCQTQSHWAIPSFIQDPPGPPPPITFWQGSQPHRPCSSVSNLRALLHGPPVSLRHNQANGEAEWRN